jgi:hypothetical protein
MLTSGRSAFVRDPRHHHHALPAPAGKDAALSSLRQLLRRWLGVDSAEHLGQRALERSARAAEASALAADSAARDGERSRQASDRVARDVRRLGRQISLLNGIVHQQADATVELLRRTGWQTSEEALEQRYLRQALQTLESRGDIIAGPWTGEVGVELLYWIPFLNWLQSQGLDGRRLIIVSRGGVGSWYGHLTSRYIDLLDFMTPGQLRQQTVETTGKRKQYDPKRALDRDILAAVESKYGVNDAAVIHPAAMFRLFGALWRKRATVSLVDSFTTFRSLGDPRPPDAALGLPATYVAAKFYFSEAFPATAENRTFAADLLRRISEQVPVVLLGRGVRIDDHTDFAAVAGPRLRVIDTDDVPPKNLERQTDIIRGACGFIGTYGGFSYLAPFFGVRSVSYFSRRGFESHHLELAHRVFDRLLPGGFVALDRRAIASVEPVVKHWTAPSTVPAGPPESSA